ncbi:unnamed protein product [Knipowitschia caucasica]|uniref:PX domain-containing protein n=1 Tax=Knipowitschia caucasica TaxID=637954 RepID=A0AAV2KXN9_KNICA
MAQEETRGAHSQDSALCSSLTTAELQHNWKEEKSRERPLKLLFQLPSHRETQTVFSRHVVFQVVVMRSGSFDSHRVSVERRYSDFSKLHQTLLQEFNEELDEISLPPKLLTGNFSEECLLERRRALQNYLSALSANPCVRRCAHFADFFTDPELRKAHSLLRAGQFHSALEMLKLVLQIQEKLAPWQSATFAVHTLAALAVCHRDLDEEEQAYAAADRALLTVRQYGPSQYRGPLLQLLVDVGFSLGRRVAQLQDEMLRLREAQRGRVDTRSLKEIVIQSFV